MLIFYEEAFMNLVLSNSQGGWWVQHRTLQKENQVLKDKLEKLSSEHVILQGTHMELEKSYEKLVELHVVIEMAHEW